MVEQVNDAVLVRLERGGVLESHHKGHLILLNSDGSVAFSLGDMEASVYPRSSIKGIQASAMVRSGLKLEPRLLALVAASHSGSDLHQSAAREILSLGGLSESALRNALDKPLGEEERRAWADKPATSLAQNCSGKHAGMLLTCVVNGWTTDDYLLPTHPLQREIRKELEVLGGELISTISVDGCGAPLFLISLRALATGIRALTISQDPVHKKVVEACKEFPEMVAGEGRSTTRLMRQVEGLFLKEGAEGVGVGALPDGRTFAFKVSDGSSRPYSLIVSACLKRLGALANEETTPIFGGNEVVGVLKPSF
ncbi:MAG: asparaginase [Actinobacteria bacterium]|nr:asparaginase [Actinomycetota bacterium]